MLKLQQLILDDALYIPTFEFNLVSTPKLVFTFNVEIFFSPNLCIIQDSNTIEKIGLAKSNGGSYVLSKSKKTLVSVTILLVIV